VQFDIYLRLVVLTCVSWKDVELNHTLLTVITKNPDIKKGLFPLAGNDTITGKGKPKTNHQYAITKAIFREYKHYKEVFLLPKHQERKVHGLER
jgi:hypothetical protein